MNGVGRMDRMTSAQEPLFERTPEKNQTAEHWWLSWKARRYLLWQGAYYAAMEVAFWEEKPLMPEHPKLSQFTTQVGTRVDVMAIMRLHDACSRRAMPILTDEGRQLVTVAAESKASRADLRRGYAERVADFNYLVCPAGLVKPSELSEHMGLLVCEGGLQMRRRAKRIDDPQLTVEDAIWPIAASCAREVRRMRPQVRDPFRIARQSDGVRATAES